MTFNHSRISHGQQTVTTSGTAEALNGGTELRVPDKELVAVNSLDSNGGAVYVGDSSVTTSNGHELVNGAGVNLRVDDVSRIHVDAASDGDGVSWIVEGDG